MPARRRKASARKPSSRRKVSLAKLRRLCLALPGAEEGSSYGTPAWKVRGRLFARLHQDGEHLVVKVSFDERELRLRARPESFRVTDHYRGYEMMLVRLDADAPDLEEAIEVSWRRGAPARLVAELDARGD